MSGKFLTSPLSGKTIELCYGSGEDTLILALESSCDETACAIVKNGREVLANTVASQIKTHRAFGGVVPEVAAREHLESINSVIYETFETAKISPENIDAIAATAGPGLVGSLLVGFNAAKTLSLVYDKPFLGINHLNAHICANYLESDFEPPFIALLVSGGHTRIMKVNSYSEMSVLGETIDDAAGEAFDKVARLLGLPYPGGVNLDKLAQNGNPDAFKFTKPKVGKYDFSFSGLKTAVLNLTQKLSQNGEPLPVEDIAASFREFITSVLIEKTVLAANDYEINKIVLAGGVAANSLLREKLLSLKEFETHIPALKYCTDNAAMVGACAYFDDDIITSLSSEVYSRTK